MPYYHYKGRNKKGRIVSGRQKGSDEKEAKERLQAKGITAKEFTELEGFLYRDISLGSGVSAKEFVLFLRQFSTLLQAGISVVESTNILAQQLSGKQFRRILSEMENELRTGRSFSHAASQHPSIFSPLFINMMKAGEAGGNLDDMLDKMASYYEKRYETRRKVMNALIYPAVIGTVAAAVVLFLLLYIVPTFAEMYNSFEADLPLITVFVLRTGELVQSIWWLLPAAAAAVFFSWNALRKRNRTFLYYSDYALLKIPVFGTLLQKAEIARMTRTLGSLFQSSVPIIQSVAIVEGTTGNAVITATLKEVRGALERGESMAGPLEKMWVFPPMVTQMTAVGEKSGSLDAMLDRIADYYEAEVDAAADQIKSLVEPIMILILAVVVGIIVASIAIPMFDIFGQVQ
ncbi:type II secretion system F family protein [Salibacterium qingdaonense]|uniref:Type IV pilus assembly protein PilC n=1 Tax=Salibacterium qingdaonense TaxID=266892 RepID=A0A1I4MSW0_9BACI|nr:type II secretion system F family protein [Salibacterium qingdaonense]SFM06167.1 type IV pilus assembly protein PilC [Salibacterium qingdaonense]